MVIPDPSSSNRTRKDDSRGHWMDATGGNGSKAAPTTSNVGRRGGSKKEKK